ncbi:guanine nucleotide-binding protein subunit alpha-13 [Platysternon megacephalum]|uniref:Guanine nucleotide-binding protein subunit alpha-13 n=1 Tax=Platysternon megacephalum TaxID=55544 RepID=A0A4D9E3D0_9SAUR|nr:guanine nucleotide-binding protein subunit alpha-13 [Platysternon megacephalum]
MEPMNQVANGEPGTEVPAEVEREDEVQALSYGFINVCCLAVQHVACVMLKAKDSAEVFSHFKSTVSNVGSMPWREWDSGEMCGSDELADACMTGAQQTGQGEVIDQHKETGKQLDNGIRDFPAMEDSPGSVNWQRA